MVKRYFLGSAARTVLAMCLIGTGHAAYAQQPEEQATDDGSLTEIIVTARKVTESLQDAAV